MPVVLAHLGPAMCMRRAWVPVPACMGCLLARVRVCMHARTQALSVGASWGVQPCLLAQVRVCMHALSV